MILSAVGAEFGGVALALPLGRRLGRLPAQIAHRRRCVRQAEKCLDLAVVDGFAVSLALLGLDRQGVGMELVQTALPPDPKLPMHTLFSFQFA